jgi:hypothetical protein
MSEGPRDRLTDRLFLPLRLSPLIPVGRLGRLLHHPPSAVRCVISATGVSNLPHVADQQQVCPRRHVSFLQQGCVPDDTCRSCITCVPNDTVCPIGNGHHLLHLPPQFRLNLMVRASARSCAERSRSPAWDELLYRKQWLTIVLGFQRPTFADRQIGPFRQPDRHT